MALTMKQFIDEANKLDPQKRTELIAAIKTLKSWGPFQRSFEGTGYGTIGAILEISQQEYTENEAATSDAENTKPFNER